METSKKRPYYARAEYRAVQFDVDARLEQGYSLKLVYEELLGLGRVTMSYRTFCDYVRGGARAREAKNKTSAEKSVPDLLS